MSSSKLTGGGGGPGFFQSGVLILRIQGKRPKAKGMGEGGEGKGYV